MRVRHLKGSVVLSRRDKDQPGDSKCIQIILLLRTHPKISLFDFSSFIIILFGKHNVIRSQKNYRIALQKTNNLLALCLTEQHCLPASSHPFHCSHHTSQHNTHTHTLFERAPTNLTHTEMNKDLIRRRMYVYTAQTLLNI